jgi:hypothetical protein
MYGLRRNGTACLELPSVGGNGGLRFDPRLAPSGALAYPESFAEAFDAVSKTTFPIG